MSDDAPGASTRATAVTDRSECYGKQLVSNLGRRNGGQRSPETQSESIKLGSREATLTRKTANFGCESSAPSTICSDWKTSSEYTPSGSGSATN